MVKKIVWCLIVIALFFLFCFFFLISAKDILSMYCGLCCGLCSSFIADSVLDAKRKKKSAAPSEEVSGDG